MGRNMTIYIKTNEISTLSGEGKNLRIQIPNEN